MEETRAASQKQSKSRRNAPPNIHKRDSVSSVDSVASTSSSQVQGRHGLSEAEPDSTNTQASAPVLRQAPTPCRVNFVEPEHRISGLSSRVWTVSDSPDAPVNEASAESQSGTADFTSSSVKPSYHAARRIPEEPSTLRTTPKSQEHNSARPLDASDVTDDRAQSKVELKGFHELSCAVVPKKSLGHSHTGAGVKAPLPTWIRGLMSFWAVIWTPVGILWTIYFLLIVAWGAALFFIIMGWTSLPLIQSFQWIEICSQVLTALFAITGLGSIPWRVRDTYHIMIIADYARLARVREKRQLMQDVLGTQPPNEMSRVPPSTSFERALLQRQESAVILVFTERERRHLRRSIRVLAKSKPWFKPLGTLSQNASSLPLVMSVIFLNDVNSAFQAVLCGFMWGVTPRKRPLWVIFMAIAGALISALIAGILITIGRWRRTKPVEKNREAFSEWSESSQRASQVKMENDNCRRLA